ncbi:putative invertase inhibitor [Curcuma longa]|uniref:putative invertase inhibitor n=1 Tax=Curcuma longa TaxID=136217 RepID=UPI003D9FB0AC
MQYFLFFLSLALALFLSMHRVSTTSPPPTCASPTNVKDACKLVADKYPAVGYDFCVKSLKKSGSGDLHNLALVATRTAIAHAASAEAEIEELMELEVDSADKNNFDKCLDAYADDVDHLRNAVDNIAARVYKKAAQQLAAAKSAAKKCEAAFAGGDNKGEVPGAAGSDCAKLASIAQAIVASLA